MKSILLVMSLSGTVMFILQMCMSLILKKFISSKAKYLLLKLSIIFYLLPLPLIKNYYIDLFGDIGNNIFSLSENKVYNTDMIISPNAGVFNISFFFVVFIILFVIIYLIIIIAVICHIRSYFLLKSTIKKYAEKVDDKDILVNLQKEKEAFGIKKDITIMVSEKIEIPVTTGFLHPVILIPKRRISTESLLWILKHELGHIYNCDYIYRILGVIVIAIHWFNPFVYLFFKMMSVYSEFNCDEFIIKDLDRMQIKNYGCTIVDFSVETKKNHTYKTMIAFGNYNVKIMKARLDNMKRFTKKGKVKNVIQITAVIATMFISSLTVFAYKEPEIAEVTVDKYNFTEVNSTSGFGEYENTEIKLPDLNKTDVVSGYFTDIEGNISKINENKEKAPCSHNFQNG